MKHNTFQRNIFRLSAAVLVLSVVAQSQDTKNSPLNKFRNQEFPPVKEKNFDEGWKVRFPSNLKS